MEHQSSKSPSISTTTTKLTQKEPIIVELKKFFLTHPPQTTITKGKLTDDVKEVTKVEMRNDLSKKQLLYILLVSLLEEESDQSMLAILKSRAHLFKTVSYCNGLESCMHIDFLFSLSRQTQTNYCCSRLGIALSLCASPSWSTRQRLPCRIGTTVKWSRKKPFWNGLKHLKRAVHWKRRVLNSLTG